MKKLLAFILSLVLLLSLFGVATSAESMLGDVNRDGDVNMKDVLHLRKFIVGQAIGIDAVAADVNRDGSIDMKDVLQIRKHIAKPFDLFAYCKNYALNKGQVYGDCVMYQQPSTLYGGYENEYFSISYWSDSDMVEFCLYCPLNDYIGECFYLRMRGGYFGQYEYLVSKFWRDDYEEVSSVTGYMNPSVFSESYPLQWDYYYGETLKQNDFLEESRVGMCDLIKCLKQFVEVENMTCGFSAFGFVNF